MAFYPWTEDLQVGIAAIDGDHKKLVQLINDLHEAMTQGRGKAVLGKTLDDLIRYTQEHFQREEQLMQRAGYSDYARHKQEHEQLVQEVVALREKFNSGNLMLSVQVSGFLRDWLTNHIMKTDKKYEPTLKKLGG